MMEEAPLYELQRPLPPRSRWVRGLAAAAIAGVFLLSFLWLAPAEGGPTLCAIRLTQGVPCPGCGLTRAFTRISHGHFAGALSFHPLSPLVYLGLLLVGVKLAFDAAANARLTSPRLERLYRRVGFRWVLVGICLFWGARMYTFIQQAGAQGLVQDILLVRCLRWLLA